MRPLNIQQISDQIEEVCMFKEDGTVSHYFGSPECKSFHDLGLFFNAPFLFVHSS